MLNPLLSFGERDRKRKRKIEGVIPSNGISDNLMPQSKVILTAIADSVQTHRTHDANKAICPLGDDTKNNMTLQRFELAWQIGGTHSTHRRKDISGMPSVVVTSSLNGLKNDIPIKLIGITDNPSASNGVDKLADNASVVTLSGPALTMHTGFDTIPPGRHVYAKPLPATVIAPGGRRVPLVQQVGEPNTKFMGELCTASALSIPALMAEIELKVNRDRTITLLASKDDLVALCNRINNELGHTHNEDTKPADYSSVAHQTFLRTAMQLVFLAFSERNVLSDNAAEFVAHALNQFQDHETLVRNRYGESIGDVELIGRKPWTKTEILDNPLPALCNLTSAMQNVQSYQADYMRALHLGVSMSTTVPGQGCPVLVGYANL